jgi:hypothetical protein
MDRKKILILPAILLIAAGDGYTQRAEDFFESIDDIPESSEFTEQLDELLRNPVDLNSASENELLRLPWLTPLMAEGIVRYREARGAIKHLSELDTLLGFDASLTTRMADFVVLPVAKERPRDIELASRSRLKLSPQTLSDCPGGRSKVYSRIGVSSRDGYALGLLVEKDACETNYADYLSSFLLFKGKRFVRGAIVGNDYLEFGEGLVFSPARFSIKSQGITKRGSRGILASKSSDENRSLLGSAVELRIGRADLSIFLSHRKVDATLNDDGSVKSLYESGLHRTATEKKKKDVLTERLYGGRAELRSEKGMCGVTLTHGTYSLPFQSTDFAGREYGLLAFNIDRLLRNARVFGEAAVSTAGSGAALLGLKYSVSRFSTGCAARRFGPDFWSPHSSSFSEYGGQNEEGAYCHARLRPVKRLTMEAYMDLFRTIRPPEPSEYCDRGHELGLVLTGRMTRSVTCELKYRRRLKRGDLRESLRAQLDATAGMIRTRIRTELATGLDTETSEQTAGDLTYLGLIVAPEDWFEAEGRIVVFSTESYDARIYVYERDLPGYVRNVALHGTGNRYYFLCRCHPRPWIHLTAKYACQRKGEIREEFGLQLDLHPSF